MKTEKGIDELKRLRHRLFGVENRLTLGLLSELRRSKPGYRIRVIDREPNALRTSVDGVYRLDMNVETDGTVVQLLLYAKTGEGSILKCIGCTTLTLADPGLFEQATVVWNEGFKTLQESLEEESETPKRSSRRRGGKR